MKELLKAISVLGLGPLMKLKQANQLAWNEILSGFYTTRTLQTLFNVGFFSELQQKGAVRIEAFAAANNLDKEILSALCDSLAALSILQKQGEEFSLDAKGRLLVEVGYGWFYGAYGYEEVFHHLEALLKKEMVYGKDITRRGDFVAVGSGEIERLIYFPLAIDIIAKRGFKKVLDFGCGDGTFLRHLCQHNPACKGYGIDISEAAIDEGRARLKRDKLEDRISLSVMDVTKIEALPEAMKDIDGATIFFVLHEVLFSGEESLLALLRAFKKLFPKVPLIAFEACLPGPEEMRKKPGMAIQYLLQHRLTRQRLTSREAWTQLFKKAGFTSIEERYLKFARTSIFIIA
ncbi:MAG: class I SAM-dependent methyltransferase [Pseudomonadota bacterium]